MGFLKKIKQLISNKKEEDKSSEVIQYNENPSNLEVIPDGEYVYYDDEDESLLVKNYRDGKLNGPSYFHYLSGELWIETNFKDGLEHGTLNYYEKDGSIIRTETWENGKCISTNQPGKKEKTEN
tara:strand:+ start:2773 stop:3144 length:372 start_codon:yes stop_codon:yes gene_type:complete